MASTGSQIKKHVEIGETPVKQKKPMSVRSATPPSTAALRSMSVEVKTGQDRLYESLNMRLEALTNTVDSLHNDTFMELNSLNDKNKDYRGESRGCCNLDPHTPHKLNTELKARWLLSTCVNM